MLLDRPKPRRALRRRRHNITTFVGVIAAALFGAYVVFMVIFLIIFGVMQIVAIRL